MAATAGCARCQDDEPDAAWRWLQAAPRTVIEQESHVSLSVVLCPACGQRWARLFTEQVDWVGGDDPQRWDLLPVGEDEAKALEGGVEVLYGQRLAWSSGRRRLVRHDGQGGPRARWEAAPWASWPQHD